ncbi:MULTISPECIES: flagellar hook-associated protein FlgK [unclassified Colwellia]|uniref:flagellar hook-associated protein FlgK n=1 Tax=unclassified Colwellia TaxID=196834 RepID=UPI0015F67A25|nr:MULTISPECIES: flagellar hook-associated protein FlgK [unclassified Colwellia]MBA6253864.1 flagellar hook-associated protein FlgK [Colwellia sp. MB3u-55]MBA6396425.1 flagellar hook-associated protein FlgK [Colwellia sp. BRX10-4]
MSVNLYNTGVSGLLAAQQQLATTGHNISNVNTEGYNRQRAEQNSSVGLYSGGNFVGSGTYVQDISRIYNQFTYKEQLSNQSNLGNADTLHKDLDQLNEIMSFSGAAINGSIEKFYQTMNSIADNPSDIGLRSIALNQAGVLASDFNTLNDNIEQLEKSANGEIVQMANAISKISGELAKINEQILQSQDLTLHGQPNDLLDKRDQLVDELGEYTSVNTIVDANGVMTVMIGNGATLVAGITPLSLSVVSGDPDSKATELRIVGANSSVALNGSVLGGSLAAKFELRDEHLSQLRREVDRMAMAISETLNQSQSGGLDLNAQQGLNIFTDINSTALQAGRVLSPSTNAGSLSASVNITDISKIPTDEFEVRFDGTNYIMTNMNDGSLQNLGAPGSGTYTTSNPDYGFEFTELSGTPAIDDSYLIRLTKNSASLMAVTLNDGKNIAASTSVGVAVSDNNVSDGKISIVNVTDPVTARTFADTTNKGLLVDVYESSAGVFSYRVYDADPLSPPPTPPSVAGAIASGTFLAGNSAVIGMPPSASPAAFQIEITGQPKGQGALAPEEFTVGDAFGLGNGANATFMALTQEKGVLNSGQETFSQSLAISTSDVGAKASSAELVSETAEALHTQAYNRNQQISGVNLDEEAANLMRFQQAYQASSRIISIANTIFDTLLQASR